MATEKQPTNWEERRKQYVTVEEAQLLCNRADRTIRRWVKEEKVRINKDASGYIRIDLDDLNKMREKSKDTVHPIRDEIKRLKIEHEDLKQQVELLQQQVNLLQQSRAPTSGESNLVSSHSRTSSQDGAERRGLPVGTQRLVPFAEQHQVTVGEIKSLYNQRLLDLTIYQRPGHAQRNKQEWWISPEQHAQLVQHWQEHHIAYAPCSQCQKRGEKEAQ